MKVSLNWIRKFGEVTLSVGELTDKIGAQLGAIEEVIDLGKKYQGIIIAKVVECEKHPNADKLSVCLIDDGGKAVNAERNEEGFVQVVCGAPNVRAGIKVAWLPPGSTVPSSFDKEPFVLEARELRGVVSNGMLASASELALSEDHSGILIIEDERAQPGEDFAEFTELNDTIIDVENKMFTHRPDCFGQLGVAREIAGITGKQFHSPEWYKNENVLDVSVSTAIRSYGVTNMVPERCPRYMLVAVDNVTVGPSPLWLQTYLTRVGIRPVNNIVDMTNYVMMETGQPLHAFDFDKVSENGNAQIIVRNPEEDEQVSLLDGKKIKPRADAVLICAKDRAIALGGVMGGDNSEIDTSTTRILIECANFDMYNIRRTSMEHGLFTDAVTRFTKGQSSWQCPAVLFRAVQLIKQLCPDSVAVGEPIDAHTPIEQPNPVSVNASFINERLGLTLGAEQIADMLRNVEFVVEVQGDGLMVAAPFWRTDIAIAEDIVEEVGRLYGFDNLPMTLPQRKLAPVSKDKMLGLKRELRSVLSSFGANEVLTYSFVHGELLKKTGQNEHMAFKVANALSPELQFYRLSLTPSLLDKVHSNIRAGYEEFAIFELNKVHNREDKDEADDNLPKEFNVLALTYANKHGKPGDAYYEARHYLEKLAKHFGLELEFMPASDELDFQVVKPFEMSRSALVRVKGMDSALGIVGEFRAGVRKSLKLPVASAGFEIGVDELVVAISEHAQPVYQPLPRFPRVVQDICLRTSSGISYQQLHSTLSEAIRANEPPQIRATLEPLDIYQREGDDVHKQTTFRYSIASYEKTMTAEEVNSLLNKAAEAAQKSFGAERV